MVLDSQSRENLGGVLIIWRGARTPSEHYRGTLEQGTDPPNADIQFCNELGTHPGLVTVKNVKACRAALVQTMESCLSRDSWFECEVRQHEYLSVDDSVQVSLEMDYSQPGQQGAESAVTQPNTASRIMRQSASHGAVAAWLTL